MDGVMKVLLNPEGGFFGSDIEETFCPKCGEPLSYVEKEDIYRHKELGPETKCLGAKQVKRESLINSFLGATKAIG